MKTLKAERFVLEDASHTVAMVLPDGDSNPG